MNRFGAWRVWLFAVYAAGLFVGTHWPALRIEGSPVPRPDLVLHFGAFAGWTFLLWFSGLTKGRVGLTACIAAVYAVIDELSQGIPALQRTVAAEDAAANVIGVGIGVVGIVLFRRVFCGWGPGRMTSVVGDGVADSDGDIC